MPAAADCRIHAITAATIDRMHELLGVFGDAFDEQATYNDQRADDEYLARLLRRDTFIALAAIGDDRVIGGLAAYELPKFERRRSEIYVYELAVAAGFRRRGIATRLLARLQQIAAERGAYVIFVQADADDPPAIALYSKLGTREDVVHFDIPPAAH